VKIDYNKRSSKFHVPVGQALDRAGGNWPVEVMLDEPADYPREAIVVIGQDPNEFEADWEQQADLFPARVKAAAHVLQRRGTFGRFRIAQEGQTVTIHPDER